MLPPTSEGGDSVPDKLLEPVSLLVVVEITGGLTGCKKKNSVLEIINQSNLVPIIILEPFFILFANCSILSARKHQLELLVIVFFLVAH